LRSRLSAGLAVPLALPGRAARRAILERTLADRGLTLAKGALRTLAEGLPLPAAELVAAALELELSAHVAGRPIEPAQVKRFLREREQARTPSLAEIARLTAKCFGLKLADLKSPQRRQPLVAARGVAMHLARQLTDRSLGQIGAYFGGRDHTTVLHGQRRTEKMMKSDPATRHAVSELRKTLVA
jgi:chromosomal replication initiator protein